MPTESPRSTLMFSAQTRSYGLKVSEGSEVSTPSKNLKISTLSQAQSPKKTQPQRVYSLLPKYNTPVRKPIRNPFNERLIEVFNKPTCSPDFCSSFASPSIENVNKNEFFWTSEDLWRLDPAPIESPQTDLEDNIDEETESLAQEAIERYFQESHNILSPIGSPKTNVLPAGLTPEIPVAQCLSERAMSTPCTRHDTRRTVKITASTQTMLSFSSDIPEALLELLKPFTNTLDESKTDISNTSSSNLRRKLLFNERCLSPSDSDDGILETSKFTSRFLPADWTPDKIKSTTDLFAKSPDISPIADGILAKQTDVYFSITRGMDSEISSPVKGDRLSNEHHHMSVDFGAESMIDSSIVQQGASQTSADTGYHTDPPASQGSAQCSTSIVITNSKKNLGRSYLGSCDASDTGITSTPTSNRLRHKKHDEF